MLNYSGGWVRPILDSPLDGGIFFDIVRPPGGRFTTMLVLMDLRPLARFADEKAP